MNIANTPVVAEIVRQAAGRLHAMVGPTHPRMTQRDQAVKAAQHHIIDLFVVELLETWVDEDLRFDEAHAVDGCGLPTE